MEGLSPNDLIRFIFTANELDRPISTFLLRVDDMIVEVLLSCNTRDLQSKDTITLDEGFFINVIKIIRPIGAGRNRRVVNPEVDRFKKGRSRVAHPKRRSCNLLKRRAMLLHRNTGIPEGPCRLEEVAIFERFLQVQIIVICSAEMQKVVYKGPGEKPENNLWLHDNHFDLINSPKGFYGSDCYCEHCNSPYKRVEAHMCEELCYICRKADCKNRLSFSMCSMQLQVSI
ncbi:hypothetical protein JTE90_028617 [Oedothorax gibbosus]|uniref:Uncharacterized protein n=1 Tax=Oedothorax gibbosus TaxID=931172 RepID=A0AAV6TXA3_9ARAC|nr:hypothetical protein JTE90_028617 [Oedothorax gibbosus]